MAANKAPANNRSLTKQSLPYSSTPNLQAHLKTMESPRAVYMTTSSNTKDLGVASFKKVTTGTLADKLAGGGHKKKPTLDNLEELVKIPSASKLSNPVHQAKSQSPAKVLELSSKGAQLSQTPKAATGPSKFPLKVITSPASKTATSKAEATNPELENTISTLNTYGLFPDQEMSPTIAPTPNSKAKRIGSEPSAENKLYSILNPAPEAKKRSLRDDLYQLKLDVEKSNQMLQKKPETSLKLGTSRSSIKKAVRGTPITRAIETSTKDRTNNSNSARKVSGDRTRSRPRSFMVQSMNISEFHLMKQIGKGKFGDVHMAIHKKSGFLVAVKRIAKQLIKQYKMENQVTQEIKLHMFSYHPSVVQLYTILDDSQYIYLIMEYMPEGTLFNLMHLKGKLTEGEVAYVMLEIGQAMQYLHGHRIAHRDIKPQNIVMAFGVSKICDFGWSAKIFNPRKTYCGTLDYAPPEILERKEYCESVDLWCLGVLAFELLAGRVPFEHEDRKEMSKRIVNVDMERLEFPEGCSADIIDLIQGLLKKTPEERLKVGAILNHPFILNNVKSPNA